MNRFFICGWIDPTGGEIESKSSDFGIPAPSEVRSIPHGGAWDRGRWIQSGGVFIEVRLNRHRYFIGEVIFQVCGSRWGGQRNRSARDGGVSSEIQGEGDVIWPCCDFEPPIDFITLRRNKDQARMVKPLHVLSSFNEAEILVGVVLGDAAGAGVLIASDVSREL